MNSFRAKIGIIGVNPFVIPPDRIMEALMNESGRKTGPIPVRGELNGHPYSQTVVKYSGAWRLYLNTPMRRASGTDVGYTVRVKVSFDPRPRAVPVLPEFSAALNRNRNAKRVFINLPPSRQKEIVRYIASLKTEESRKRNVRRALRFLMGNERFVGRSKP